MTNSFDSLFTLFDFQNEKTTNKSTDNKVDIKKDNIVEANSEHCTPAISTDTPNANQYELMIIPPQNMTSVYGLIHKISIMEAENANSFKKSELTTSATTFEKLSAQVDAQIQEAEAAEKANGTTSKTNISKAKEDDFAINEETIIRYYKEIIPITNYFTLDEINNGIQKKKRDDTIEIKKIDGEMVRQRLEKEFPELVKDYTEMKYIGKNKNFIIPVTIAKKKGCKGEVRIGVESSIDDPTSFKFPSKIPLKLLLQFINLARVYADFKLEVRGEFYYNFDTEEFLLHIPKQTVSSELVISDEEPGYYEVMQLETNGHFVQLACEIHSHHVYRPLPSSIDNASERKPGMFYMIVGNFQKADFPEIYLRTFLSDGNNAWHESCELQTIFEDDHTPHTYNQLPTDINLKDIKVNILGGHYV